MAMRCLLVLLAVAGAAAPASAQVFTFNNGTVQGWVMEGAFLSPSGGTDPTHNFQLTWDDTTNGLGTVGADSPGNNIGSVRMQLPVSGTGIVGQAGDTNWIMRLTSPDLSAMSSWQGAVGYSVRLRNTLTPGPIFANLFVRVFDVDQGMDRFFFNGTAVQVNTAGWVTFSFDWSDVVTFPTNYQIRGIFVNVWGQTSSSYTPGAVYLDDVAGVSDTAPPAVTITQPTIAATFATSSGAITLDGAASDNERVTRVSWVNDRGGSGLATDLGVPPFTAWSVASVPLQLGVNVITVTARDVAQNTATDTLTVTRDGTAPTISITQPTSGPAFSTTASAIALGGPAADNVQVTSVTWANDRGGSGAAVAGGSPPPFSTWSVASVPLQPGGNVITVTARDAAQNATTDTLTVTRTDPAPTVAGVSPARGSTAGGTLVRVRGTGFTSGTTVTVGGQAALSRILSATELTFVAPARPAGPAPVVVTAPGGTANATFTYVVPTVSPLAGARRLAFNYDGRYVAFDSARALDPADTNGVADVYVFDKVSGGLRRVSISTAGAQAVGGESLNPAISASGRFVAFESRAANLVTGDTNGLMDVFVHDRDADEDGVFDEPRAVLTLRASEGPARVELVDGSSSHPSISGDGRYVAFESTTLQGRGAVHASDVYVHDRLRRVTTRLSVTAAGQPANGNSNHAAISQDGRYVAFDSLASDLVAGDGNGVRDVFLRDRDGDGDGVMDEAGQASTVRVSVSSAAVQGNGASGRPSLTGDGRYAVFESLATNLAPPVIDDNGESDLFIRDVVAGTTRCLTVRPDGHTFTGPSHTPRISANGAKLVFVTSGLNAPVPVAPFRAGLDDGKSTTGEIPDPTNPESAPQVDPPLPGENAGDPDVSGDGSDTGSTGNPTPGSGEPDVTGHIDGIEEGPEDPPFVGAILPSSGPTGGGNVVTIEGARFVPSSEVRWGAAALPGPNVLEITDTRIRLTPPAGAGRIDVRVRNGGLESDALAYTYVATLSAPVITTLAPGEGPVTRNPLLSMTISGSGFSSPTVRIGEAAAAVTASSPSSITVTVPDALVAGPVPVVVTNGDGATAQAPAAFVYTDVPAPLAITAIQPSSGPVTGGTTVIILGAGFTPAAAVSIDGMPATDVQVLSSGAIMTTTPAGVAGARSLRVTVPGLAPVDRPFTFTPAAAAVTVCSGGGDADLDDVDDTWEQQYGLSSVDASDALADPDGDGRSSFQECQDNTHPRGLYTRFLAEGATGSFFSTRVAVANPGTMPARVLLRFATQSGAVTPHFVLVPARSRRTIDLATLPGLADANVSTIVESDAELVIDRTMRWDQATRAGAHAEASIAAPAFTWYLAEGATHGFFDLFYLIENPSLTATASVQVRFLLPAGPPIVRTYSVAPNTRFTLPVDTIAGLEATDVSGVITATNGVPIIVERAMYSSAAGTFAAGHDAAGVTNPSTTWFFAEGATGQFFDLFLLLANPGVQDAEVTIRYLLPGGATVDASHRIPANSRQTYFVAAESPALADTAVSATVTSTNGVPIIAERSMWWPHGAPWTEAHAAAGSTVTGVKWAVADGEVGLPPENTATYLLVANTSAVEAVVRVSLLFESGAPVSKEFRVAANSRFNIPVVADSEPDGPGHIRVPAGTRFSAVIESLGATPARIVVERAMYWNANGQIWAAGSDLLAIRLQ